MCILPRFCKIFSMGENFFTSKQAAKTVGCSLRQLQYWREKEVVVPTIKGSGTGRSIYYTQSDVVRLAIMEYLLSVGLSFSEATRGLKELIETDFYHADPNSKKRWMLCWDQKMRSLVLKEFDREKAKIFLDKGQAVIPIWLDIIHNRLTEKNF